MTSTRFPWIAEKHTCKNQIDLISYNTRCQDLHILMYKTELLKNGYDYSALKAFNATPTAIRELSTLNRFKKQLKTY